MNMYKLAITTRMHN